MAIRLQVRRDTSTNWTTNNPILQIGEIGFDTTVNRFKIGIASNETSRWNALPYLNVLPSEITESAQDALKSAFDAGTHTNITVNFDDALNKISLSAGPDVVTTTSLNNTLTNATTGYVPIADVGQPDGVASLDATGLIPDSQIPSTIARDSEIPSLTGYATETYVGTSVSTHNSATTSIHGITNTADLATKNYVDTAISNLVDAAPTTLNTLNELAAALGDDPNYATTISTSLGNKLDSSAAASTYLTQSNAASTYATKASPTFTGTVSGITKSMVGLGNVDNTSDADKPISTATQTALNTKLNSSTASSTYAPIASPTFTGTVSGITKTMVGLSNVDNTSDANKPVSTATQTALDNKTDKITTANPQPSSYTVATSDSGKMIEMSGGGTLTITDSASFPTGFTVNVLQTGSSQVTLSGNGFTINATPGLKLRAQWSSATLVKRALNSWVAMGDLSA